MVVADFFDLKTKSWLVLADRFTGWVSVHYFNEDSRAQQLIKTLRTVFATFGAPDHLTTDQGPQFKSAALSQFLTRYEVSCHRMSSTYFPHSNLRAQTAVKSAKRLLMTGTKPNGEPKWDEITQALMQHRNTPISDLNLSPAQLLFGRPIKDFLPIRPEMFNPAEV